MIDAKYAVIGAGNDADEARAWLRKSSSNDGSGNPAGSHARRYGAKALPQQRLAADQLNVPLAALETAKVPCGPIT